MKKILLAISLGLWLFLNTTYAENEYLETLDNVATNRAWSEIDSSSIKNLLISIWDSIFIPIVIVIWLLLAFVGFYKLMFSDKEDERKKWVNFFLWGTAWVIMMVSAKFIANTLFGESGTSWIFGISGWQNYDPAKIAANIYDKIISKFFYLAMYLVIGILFIILVINLVKFLSNPDKEEIQKNAKTIVIWNTIWILLILLSKNIIETFYSKIGSWAYTLGQQNAILESKQLPWFYTILNYFLGFVAFAITVFIIYQAFQLLLKPEDDATYKNLRKYFVYSLIWVAIIGWVSIIANFFIIK